MVVQQSTAIILAGSDCICTVTDHSSKSMREWEGGEREGREREREREREGWRKGGREHNGCYQHFIRIIIFVSYTVYGSEREGGREEKREGWREK